MTHYAFLFQIFYEKQHDEQIKAALGNLVQSKPQEEYYETAFFFLLKVLIQILVFWERIFEFVLVQQV